MYACTFLVISMQLQTSAHDPRPPSPTPELHILSLLLLLLSVESLPLAPTLPPTTTSSPTPVYSGSDPNLVTFQTRACDALLLQLRTSYTRTPSHLHLQNSSHI